jgi:hypothetical protein
LVLGSQSGEGVSGRFWMTNRLHVRGSSSTRALCLHGCGTRRDSHAFFIHAYFDHRVLRLIEQEPLSSLFSVLAICFNTSLELPKGSHDIFNLNSPKNNAAAKSPGEKLIDNIHQLFNDLVLLTKINICIKQRCMTEPVSS